MGFNQLSQTGDKNTTPFTHLTKTPGLFFTKPHLTLEPQKDSQNRCALLRLELFVNTTLPLFCWPAVLKYQQRTALGDFTEI